MYLAIDLETTGLDPEHDCILEIAAVILDEFLEEVSPWCVVRVARPSSTLARMPDVVKEMHTKTGLIRERGGVWSVVEGLAPHEAARELLRIMLGWRTDRDPVEKLELLGCGVHFDAKFLAPFCNVHAPSILNMLSHRHFDSRTAKSIAHLRTDVFGARTAEMTEHTAKGDVLRSIADLKLARRIFANGIRVMEEDCTAPWLGKLDAPVHPTIAVFREKHSGDPAMQDRIARELFGDEVVDADAHMIKTIQHEELDRRYGAPPIEDGLHGRPLQTPPDHEVLPDAPSEDTADDYTAAVEAGDPSTPVALADAQTPANPRPESKHDKDYFDGPT